MYLHLSNSIINISTISENVLSSKLIYKFLNKTPLKQLTFSRILHEYWRYFKIQTEDSDCEFLIILLQKMDESDIDDEHKQCIKSLQDSIKVFFSILIILLWYVKWYS